MTGKIKSTYLFKVILRLSIIEKGLEIVQKTGDTKLYFMICNGTGETFRQLNDHENGFEYRK